LLNIKPILLTLANPLIATSVIAKKTMLVKLIADTRDIWKFINPLLIAEPTLLTLAKPLIAIFIVAKKTMLVKLIADERDAYKLLY